GGLAFQPVVHEQILHHGRDFRVQRQRDVRAVHVRNRVHDQRDGDEAQPALWFYGIQAWRVVNRRTRRCSMVNFCAKEHGGPAKSPACPCERLSETTAVTSRRMMFASPSGIFSVVQPGRVFAGPPDLALPAFAQQFPPPTAHRRTVFVPAGNSHTGEPLPSSTDRAPKPAGTRSPPPHSSAAFPRHRWFAAPATRKLRRENCAAWKTSTENKRFG